MPTISKELRGQHIYYIFSLSLFFFLPNYVEGKKYSQGLFLDILHLRIEFASIFNHFYKNIYNLNILSIYEIIVFLN